MLAGDPDEALEFAEQLLKERSLSSYYDEVALKGLQLAANDASRGVLTGAQLERIKEAIKALVADLDAGDDVEPAPAEKAEARPPRSRRPPTSGAAQEAGRARSGAARSASSRRLARGAARHLPRRARPPRRGGLHHAGPAPAQARARRAGRAARGRVAHQDARPRRRGRGDGLHLLPRDQRHPGASALPPAPAAAAGCRRPILVGLWPAEDAVLSDEKMRTAIGADYYVTSLREAVKRCLEAAWRRPGKALAGNPNERVPHRLFCLPENR